MPNSKNILDTLGDMFGSKSDKTDGSDSSIEKVVGDIAKKATDAFGSKTEGGDATSSINPIAEKIGDVVENVIDSTLDKLGK